MRLGQIDLVEDYEPLSDSYRSGSFECDRAKGGLGTGPSL
jgi:hypothetical protein